MTSTPIYDALLAEWKQTHGGRCPGQPEPRRDQNGRWVGNGAKASKASKRRRRR